MTHRTGSAGRPRYGAIELKDSSHFYMMAGLGIAIAIHLAVVTSYKLVGGTGTVPVTIVNPFPGTTIYFPPSINPTTLGGVNVSTPGRKRSVGIPVPVPEPIADPAVELAPNVDFHPITGMEGEVGRPGGADNPTPTRPEESVPLPFTPVEDLPRIVLSAVPAYPDLALRAGLEGKVTVRLWVDTEGKPRDVSVFTSDGDIFNEAAVAAAKQYLFTPAIMNGVPVSVWITIPFRFRLADKR